MSRQIPVTYLPPMNPVITLSMTRREALILRRMLEAFEKNLDANSRHLRHRVQDDVTMMLATEARTFIERLHADLDTQDVSK